MKISRSFIIKLAAGCLLINLTVWFLVGMSLYQSRQGYEEHAELTTKNTAHSIALNVSGIIDKVNLSLTGIVYEIENQLSAGSIDREKLNACFRLHHSGLTELEAMRFADVNGNIMYGTSTLQGPFANIAERNYFRILRENPDAGLVISEPVIGRITKTWVIGIARRVNGPDGSFRGVAFGVMELSYFRRMFSSLDTGKDGSISLRDENLSIIACYPEAEEKISHSGNSSVSPAVFDLVKSSAGQGTYRAESKIDGMIRTVSYEKIPKYGFYVFAGQADTDYPVSWCMTEVLTVSIACLFTFFTVFTAAMTYRKRKDDLLYMQELQKSRQRFEDIAEHNREVIWETGLDGKFTYISREWLAISGFAPDEITGKMFFYDLFPEAEYHQFRQAAQSIFVKRKAFNDIHYPIITRDRSIKWVSVCGMPVMENGKIMGFRGSASDITDIKRAEESLKEAQRIALLGNWEYDIVNNRLFWSDEIYNIFEIDKNDFGASYEAFLEAVHPKDRETVNNAYSESLKKRTPYNINHRLLMKDGRIKYVQERCEIFFDRNGMPVRSSGTVQDITDRKFAEEELRISEERFRMITEHSPLALVLSKGNEQTVEYINRRFRELFGYGKNDIASLDEWWNMAYPEGEYRDIIKNRWDERVEKAIKNGSSIEPVEALVTCADGTEKTIEWGFISRGNHNIIYGLDLTERKKAEEEKTRLESQLQQSRKMESIGRLAGGVAHDFNNMLCAIIGHTDLAMMKLAKSGNMTGREDLVEILKAAERSADLIRQLLAFARRQEIIPRSVDLNEAISGMIRMLKRLIGEDISLEWNPGDDLWKIRIDLSQIDQIMANLCINARDAIADTGNITIETEKTVVDSRCLYSKDPDLAPGEYVVLSVSDNGAGMDRRTLEHIFEPFFTTKETGKGTGLGLATVYGIVKQNNGFISVYSEPDHGTIFRIYIPRYSGDETETKTVEPENIIQQGNETVLLVEDEHSILDMIRDMFEMNGYTVLAANSPDEAFNVAAGYNRTVHLLVTDVIMPGMNGKDMAIKLKSLYPELKIIFMSGYTANTIAHHGVLEDGMDFIQKPFSMNSLIKKVREVLDR